MRTVRLPKLSLKTRSPPGPRRSAAAGVPTEAGGPGGTFNGSRAGVLAATASGRTAAACRTAGPSLKIMLQAAAGPPPGAVQPPPVPTDSEMAVSAGCTAL